MTDATTSAARGFWLRHAIIPLAIALGLIALFGLTDLDRWLATRWAWDAAAGQFIAHDSLLANSIVHRGGRVAIWAVALICLIGWLVNRRRDGALSRAFGFSLIALALSIGVAAGLKQITNVDCPWDLQGFGGDRPYVHLFADRPDDLPTAKCYPAAHSSSGFALFALYFGFRNTHRRVALASLAAALITGGIFGLAQQARGAHFLSHDLTSAMLTWFVCLGLYVRVLWHSKY
ncbi:MAG TPA: phosphatase PAP2 family protein [Steroidobacteraceae bacterium]|nr:phosphatase PAP2 family protein [Steroidobacteraceae bacterium]HRX90249.1 phosphatase PAP2 family protein [Steroidobacteraceae bacterium]